MSLNFSRIPYLSAQVIKSRHGSIVHCMYHFPPLHVSCSRSIDGWTPGWRYWYTYSLRFLWTMFLVWGTVSSCLVGVYMALSYTHARHFPYHTTTFHHTTLPPLPLNQTPNNTTITPTLIFHQHKPLPHTQWQTNGPQKGSSPVYSCT